MPAPPGSQPSPGRIGDHAIVLGASMAGLLAARVLADAYAQVTIIDRDQLPPAGTHRRGVPHGRHLHALLARGQQALEELFPGLTDELVAQGVPAGDVLGNGRCYLNEGVRDVGSQWILSCLPSMLVGRSRTPAGMWSTVVGVTRSRSRYGVGASRARVRGSSLRCRGRLRVGHVG
jgi:hypothetical protein